MERRTFVSWATSDCDSPVSNRVSTLVLVGVVHSLFGGWRGGVFIVVTLWEVVVMGKIFTVAAHLFCREARTYNLGCGGKINPCLALSLLVAAPHNHCHRGYRGRIIFHSPRHVSDEHLMSPGETAIKQATRRTKEHHH